MQVQGQREEEGEEEEVQNIEFPPFFSVFPQLSQFFFKFQREGGGEEEEVQNIEFPPF